MHTVAVEFLVAVHKFEQLPWPDKPELAFAGRSNVGKSSLINTLLGQRNLARVSATPGRTRALNFFEVPPDWRFVDLPGYGYAAVPVAMRNAWDELLSRYLAERTSLKGVVLILDIRREVMESDKQLMEFLLSHGRPVLVVATKADKFSRQQAEKQLVAIARDLNLPRELVIAYSSLDGTGRQAVWEEVSALLQQGSQEMREMRRQIDRERAGHGPVMTPSEPEDPSDIQTYIPRPELDVPRSGPAPRRSSAPAASSRSARGDAGGAPRAGGRAKPARAGEGGKPARAGGSGREAAAAGSGRSGASSSSASSRRASSRGASSEPSAPPRGRPEGGTAKPRPPRARRTAAPAAPKPKRSR